MLILKRVFLAYVLFCIATCLTLATSTTLSRARDPDTLHCPFASAIQTLDPFVISDAMTGVMMTDVYESLYYPPYGEQGDRLVPVLAADFPTVSPDQLTYTIPLRRGVRFYDPTKTIWPDGVGRELTADDVIYSFKRLADFRVASPAYSTNIQGRIVGVDEFHDWSAKAPGPPGTGYDDHPIAGLKALDPHTLQIRFTKPWPLFEYLLGEQWITCHEAIDRFGTLAEHAIGTGPYALAEYRNSLRVVLKRNPVYRGRADGDAPATPEQRIPSIPTIQYEFMPESLPAWHLFLQGRYDLSVVPKEVFSEVMDDDMKLRPSFAQRSLCAERSIASNVYFLRLNFKDPLLGTSPDLRHAMSLAIDRETFVRVYRSNNAVPADSFIPICSPTRVPGYKGKWAHHDPDAARALVRKVEASLGKPLPAFKLMLPDTDSQTRQSAEFLVKQFGDVGIQVVPEYLSQARAIERIDSRDFQMYFWGWSAGPDDYTFYMLCDKAQIPSPNFNDGGYENPRFQELFDKASLMRRSPERDAMYHQMTEILDDDLPTIPVYYPYSLTLRYARVGNYKTSPLTVPYRAHLTLGRPGRGTPARP